LARINALGRRGTTGCGIDELPDTAPFEFDLERKLLQRDGVDISLTHREFELACFMFRQAGRVVARGHILESTWGMHDGDVSARTVDTHMSRLRKKLDLDDAGWTLTAVYQHGYRLEGLADGESGRNEED
jgi:DNA-binding response OmpR family regulator